MQRPETFSGESMSQALAAAKQALGSDAIIISAKEWPASLFRPARCELKAIPPDSIDTQHQEPNNHKKNIIKQIYRKDQQEEESLTLSSLTEQIEPLYKELEKLRLQLQGSYKNPRSAAAQNCRKWLLQQDINPEICSLLVQKVSASRRLRKNNEAWKDFLIQEVAKFFRISGAFWCEPPLPKRIAFCGPTGVGKTTTLAKIAAKATYEHHMKVQIITLDTFRVGAVDQLHQYSHLLGVQLWVAKDSYHFSAALKDSNADLVFIDTAGRSPGDQQHQQWLKQLFVQHGIDPVLVLPAAMRQSEFIKALSVFDELKPSQIIFTKLDEAAQFGLLLNATERCRLPLAFVACGQRVPEDLAIPDIHALAKLVILGGIHDA